MLPRIAITGLAAAALIVGTALIPNGASARGAQGVGAGAVGPWPPDWGTRCSWVYVKYYAHKRAYWRSVCQ